MRVEKKGLSRLLSNFQADHVTKTTTEAWERIESVRSSAAALFFDVVASAISGRALLLSGHTVCLRSHFY